MDVILNIGLDKVAPEGQSYTNGQRNPAVLERLFTAVQHLRNWKMAPVRAKLCVSDTGPTLVAVLDWDARSMAELVLRLNEVSIELNQDCIALWVPRLQHGTSGGSAPPPGARSTPSSS